MARARRPPSHKVHREPVPILERDRLQELRSVLDHHGGFEAMLDPGAQATMRAFVKGAGSCTRPELAAQAFAFAIELERQRVKAALQIVTWPCHDHMPPDASMEELMAHAQRANPAPS